AVLVAQAKVHRYQMPSLSRSAEGVLKALKRHRRSNDEYEEHKFADLSDADYAAELRPVASFVPAIPNLLHWFRRYVVIDLARMRRAIERADIPETHRLLLRA